MYPRALPHWCLLTCVSPGLNMGDRGEVVEWYGMGPDPGPGFRIGATCGRDTSYSDDDEEEVKEGSAAVAAMPTSGVQYRGSTSRPRVTREAEVMASAIGDVVVGVHVSGCSACCCVTMKAKPKQSTQP
jgi:hypothetical protein